MNNINQIGLKKSNPTTGGNNNALTGNNTMDNRILSGNMQISQPYGGGANQSRNFEKMINVRNNYTEGENVYL